MKVRNLVLFGFVLSALNYLALQVKDEKEASNLDELKNVNLEQLRQQVGDRLQQMVSEFGTAVNSIVNIGAEAFDAYMLDMQKNETENNEVKEDKTNSDDEDLNNLMSYIKEAFAQSNKEELLAKSEDDKALEQETDLETNKEETSEKEDISFIEKERDQEDELETESEKAGEIKETCEEIEQEENREIINNDENLPIEEVSNDNQEANLEDDFVEEKEEDQESEEVDQEKEEENKESEADESETTSSLDEEREEVAPEINSEDDLPPLSSSEQEEMIANLKELLAQEEEDKPVEEKGLDDYKKEIASSLAEKDDKEVDALDYTESTPQESEVEAKTIDFDELFSSIFNDEETSEKPLNEASESDDKQEDKEETKIDDYVSNLIADLPTSLDKKEEEKSEFEFVSTDKEETSEQPKEVVNNDEHIYQQINELYPYLNRDFIVSVYELKETIAENYPLNNYVVVLHRINFKELDDLRQFVEIVSNHGYSVNVDEKKMIVDCFRRYLNTDGKILNNIFEIANQAGLLRGIYEGYWIDIEKDNN